MNQNEKPIIVGLDIGTTKIVAIAAQKNEFGKLVIVGFGKADSIGVIHGQVFNINQVVGSVNKALANCLKSNPDIEVIEEVYIGVAGQHIKSFQSAGEIIRKDSEIVISKEEVLELKKSQYKISIPGGDKIIGIIPQEYFVDSNQNIKDPVGCLGTKFGGNFHIITGDNLAIRNINRAVENSGINNPLKIKDLVLQPLASAMAVLGTEDYEAGVAVLDIGGGTSDLAVYCDGVLKHTEVIPFGGENITEDIRKGLGGIKATAEALKIQFGSALSDEIKINSIISIPSIRGMSAKEISVHTLSKIIQSRMEEILEYVASILTQKGFNKNVLNHGLILTGGGSQLKHLKQLSEYITSLDVRIGYPNEHLAPNQIEELREPMYATCIGLILKGYYDYEQELSDFEFTNNQKRISANHFRAQYKNDSLTPGIKTEIAPSPVLPIEKKKENASKNNGRINIFEVLKGKLIDLFPIEEEDRKIN